jgi:DNA adenine methylase
MAKAMTPLRYPGGKSKVIKNVLSPLFPQDFKEFYEPFIGGGSVALWIAQENQNMKIHINDLNDKLITFWRNLQTEPEELVRILHETRDLFEPTDVDEGKRLLSEKQNDLYNSEWGMDKAVAFYVLNKISFSGLTEHGSISKAAYEKTFNHTNIDRLVEISENMKNFHISNSHFNTFMLSPTEDDFTFLDPPYQIESSNLYGKKGEMHSGFDHKEFLESVKAMKGRWMITYNDNEWLREQYKDYNIIDQEYRYCMSFGKDEVGNKKTRMKNELIITNYDL